MGAGRVVCVAMPLILTLASLIILLYAVLTGVTHQNLRIIRGDLTNLTLDSSSIASAVKSIFDLSKRNDIQTGQITGDITGNVTAANLGLGIFYDITLWGYCTTYGNGTRICSKPEFNWAANTFSVENTTIDGVSLNQLSDGVKSAITTFGTVTKWTEIVFILALIFLGIELFLGIFSNFSRVVSCLTWVQSLFATLLVMVACALTTAMAVVVKGVIDDNKSAAGAKIDIDWTFLALVWVGAALALGASLFWVFTVCCCKPERRRSRRKNRDSSMSRRSAGRDDEKNMVLGGIDPRGYSPLTTGSNSMNNISHVGGSSRPDLVYEPYSHRV